jgi:hypothetical protein
MSRLVSFARIGRLLGAALLLAVLTVTTAPRPVSAYTTRYLSLVSLKCIETEDWTGADEPYLIVRYGITDNVVWSGSLNDGQTADLKPLPSFPFHVYERGGSVQILLLDRDSPDENDLLGKVTVSSTEAGLGYRTVKFNDDGANYELTYYVAGP